MQQQEEDMKSTKRKQGANTSYQNRNEQIEQTLQYSLVAHKFVTTARTAYYRRKQHSLVVSFLVKAQNTI